MKKKPFPPNSNRLLLVEVLPGGEISENGEYRKNFLFFLGIVASPRI
jgi:hypothetical protein